MTKSTEEQPAAVSAKTIRAREILRLIVQVEPKVWTERMLTALVQGVKGGKWFSLIDKVHPERTLQAAFSQVAANQGAAGVDHVTISMFETRLDEELRRLSEHLRNGTYRPQAIRRHYIPKPGTQEKRPLGIPTVRDRVVQTGLLHHHRKSMNIRELRIWTWVNASDCPARSYAQSVAPGAVSSLLQATYVDQEKQRKSCSYKDLCLYC